MAGNLAKMSSKVLDAYKKQGEPCQHFANDSQSTQIHAVSGSEIITRELIFSLFYSQSNDFDVIAALQQGSPEGFIWYLASLIDYLNN